MEKLLHLYKNILVSIQDELLHELSLTDDLQCLHGEGAGGRPTEAI